MAPTKWWYAEGDTGPRSVLLGLVKGFVFKGEKVVIHSVYIYILYNIEGGRDSNGPTGSLTPSQHCRDLLRSS